VQLRHECPQPGYDDWNRLLYDDCGSGNWGQSFSYDIYDNLTKAVISGRTGVTWNPGYSSTTNQVTGNTYDSNGNTTVDYLAHNYAWNEFSKMKSVDISGTNCATSGECLVRDAFGRVVERPCSKRCHSIPRRRSRGTRVPE
jgi:hypothetical protein